MSASLAGLGGLCFEKLPDFHATPMCSNMTFINGMSQLLVGILLDSVTKLQINSGVQLLQDGSVALTA